MMIRRKSERLTAAGMLIAVGIILPFATAHGLGMQGNVLLPMHIPVFLCGILCGAPLGAVCGLILPVLNCFLTGMPSLYPMMPIMAAELMTYGLVSGLLYNNTPLKKVKLGVYPTLLGAMLLGRVMYGIIFGLLFFMNNGLKALSVWGAVIKGIPGIVIQLILIPCIIAAVKGSRRIGRKNAVASALNLISDDVAACIVIKDNTIIKTEYGRGIAPVIELLEGGFLKDAYIVDKVIGKAAAMIFTLGGAKGCYGITVSASAAEWLKNNGVEVKYENLVDMIVNRTGDGMCPMEQTVLNMDNDEEALAALKNKVHELRQNQKER